MYAQQREKGLTTVDLGQGVRLIQSLVQQSLVGNTEPFLTSWRFEQDLYRIQQSLSVSIADLSFDDLTILLPVAFILYGYRITGGKAAAGHRFWEIRFVGDTSYAGIGAVVEHTKDLLAYQKLMVQHNYVLGVFYSMEKAPLPADVVFAHVRVMHQEDLTNLFMALAAVEYLDTFVLTISSISGFKAKARAVLNMLTQESDFSWERVSAIARRWTVLMEEYL